jgi:hypothetical protein
MEAQRITNDNKKSLFSAIEAYNVPVVIDEPDLFILGPSAVDGTYALGAREGDEWAVRSYIDADDPRMRLILALTSLKTAMEG